MVAVDQISDRERVVRYFGVDLREFGIVPAQILITNNGRRSVTIEPADVLVSESQRVIDPLPPGYVAELAVEAAANSCSAAASTSAKRR